MAEKLKTVEALGARIRAIRREQGISQEMLAGLAGTGQRYISELERGKETIRVREMLRVLDALGCGIYIPNRQESV